RLAGGQRGAGGGDLLALGRLRGGGRGDLVDLAVLERSLLGGLRRRLVLQGPAALLVVLGEEVGFLGLLLALEGGQGDLQGLADLLRAGQGEADAEDQRQVQQGGDEQGEAQAVRGA